MFGNLWTVLWPLVAKSDTSSVSPLSEEVSDAKTVLWNLQYSNHDRSLNV